MDDYLARSLYAQDIHLDTCKPTDHKVIRCAQPQGLPHHVPSCGLLLLFNIHQYIYQYISKVYGEGAGLRRVVNTVICCSVSSGSLGEATTSTSLCMMCDLRCRPNHHY